MSDLVPFPVSLNLPVEFLGHYSYLSLLRLNFFLRVSSVPISTAPHIRPRDTEGERMCGAIWLLGAIPTELKRQREKANSPVVQVVQPESLLERLSDCRTVPYLRFFLVRNEEAGGSNPLSSTIFQKGTSSVHRGSNRFVPGRRRFGLSGCYGESLCAKS